MFEKSDNFVKCINEQYIWLDTDFLQTLLPINHPFTFLKKNGLCGMFNFFR